MNYPAPLPAAEQMALCARAQNGDRAARDRLVLTTMRLVVLRAHTMRRGLSEDITDDLIGEGVVGVMRAIDKFDPTKGANFATYARMWIDNHIAMTVRRERGIDDQVANARATINAYHAIAAELGHEKAIETVAVSHRSRPDVLRARVEASRRGRAKSLDAPVLESGEALVELIADDVGANPETVVICENEQTRAARAIERALSVLPDREREIVRRRHLADEDDAETLADIGRTFGISRERVRQLEAKAFPVFKRQLKRALNIAAIKTYSHNHYLRRKAKGICQCGKPAKPGKTTCGEHRASPEKVAAYRKRLGKLGMCPSHPRARGADGGRYCTKCVMKRRAAAKRRREQFKLKARCQLCGAPNPISGRCQKCRDERRARKLTQRGVTIIATAGLVMLAGCGGYDPSPPDSAREQEVTVIAGIAAWEARFGSAPDCHRQHLTLGWASADDQAFESLCAAEPGWDGCCIVRQDVGTTIVLRAVPMEQTYLEWLRAHEVTHFLEHCSGRVSNGDPDHADDEVWDSQIDATLDLAKSYDDEHED